MSHILQLQAIPPCLIQHLHLPTLHVTLLYPVDMVPAYATIDSLHHFAITFHSIMAHSLPSHLFHHTLYHCVPFFHITLGTFTFYASMLHQVPSYSTPPCHTQHTCIPFLSNTQHHHISFLHAACSITFCSSISHMIRSYAIPITLSHLTH